MAGSLCTSNGLCPSSTKKRRFWSLAVANSSLLFDVIKSITSCSPFWEGFEPLKACYVQTAHLHVREQTQFRWHKQESTSEASAIVFDYLATWCDFFRLEKWLVVGVGSFCSSPCFSVLSWARWWISILLVFKGSSNIYWWAAFELAVQKCWPFFPQFGGQFKWKISNHFPSSSNSMVRLTWNQVLTCALKQTKNRPKCTQKYSNIIKLASLSERRR